MSFGKEDRGNVLLWDECDYVAGRHVCILSSFPSGGMSLNLSFIPQQYIASIFFAKVDAECSTSDSGLSRVNPDLAQHSTVHSAHELWQRRL
jgi:hypothetical protein